MHFPDHRPSVHGRVHLIARPIQETSVNERNAVCCCIDARFQVYSCPTLLIHDAELYSVTREPQQIFDCAE